MSAAYLIAAVRTPGGKAKKGKLRDVRPDDLAAVALRAAVERAGIDPARIDDVILGCAFPEGEQGMNVARVASMRAGLPVQVPAQTVNRFCASGLQAIATAAERIAAGAADLILAGGVESMSLVPMGGNKYSANPSLVSSWPEAYAGMGITAELVAKKYGVSRADQDAFAAESHRRAARAQAEGWFTGELVPVDVETTAVIAGKLSRATERLEADEGVRGDTTAEGLGQAQARLPGGRDGHRRQRLPDDRRRRRGGGGLGALPEGERREAAGALRLLRRARRRPRADGHRPDRGHPAGAPRAGLKQDDIDVFELNEAFAAQSLACVRELGLDPARVNATGGAIALGHPLGCTGAKLTATLLHEMRRTGGRYGVVSMCIGGGMGAAGLFERL